MSLDYSQYNGNRVQGIFQSRRKIISYLLLHGSATRRELAEELQVTFPAVATHVNELLESEVIESSGSIQQGKNRRTQEFVLSMPSKSCYGISLSSRGAEAFEVNLDGSLVGRTFFGASSASLPDVIHSLRKALELVEGTGMDSVVVVVDGIVSTEHGVVFKVNGVSDWEASSLLFLCKNPRWNCEIRFVTRWRALVRGWGQELKTLHSIGVFELREHQLHVCSYDNGCCQLGHIGTESGHFHLAIPGGKPCYCGRSDCFLAGIHAGNQSPDYVKAGIMQLSDSLNLKHVGVAVENCGEGDPARWGSMLLADTDSLYGKGVACLAAEQEWLQMLRRLFAPDFTLSGIVNEYSSLF